MATTLVERRSNRRYRLEMPARYRAIKQDQAIVSGVGLTQDMSSGGIALTADAELPRGSLIEAWVTWPATSEDMTCVELHIAGRVVRSSGLEAAIEMKRHAFVTYRKRAQSGMETA
jgi:hypothetical protein